MYTLVMRLEGPMQSWGTQSRFGVRDTEREPSKSGVIGLVCAALGRSRDAPLDDLRELRMGVRVDREGKVERDFQTAGGVHGNGERYGVVTADGKPGSTVVSSRYYLSDASFVVGLEGAERGILEAIAIALAAPRWPLFLGRKACPPGRPVDATIHEGTLERVLPAMPWLARSEREVARRPEKLRVVMETGDGCGDVGDADAAMVERRRDVPMSFAERTFVTRRVVTGWMALDSSLVQRDEICTYRD